MYLYPLQLTGKKRNWWFSTVFTSEIILITTNVVSTSILRSHYCSNQYATTKIWLINIFSCQCTWKMFTLHILQFMNCYSSNYFKKLLCTYIFVILIYFYSIWGALKCYEVSRTIFFVQDDLNCPTTTFSGTFLNF